MVKLKEDDEEAEKYILHFADGYAYMGEYPIWAEKEKEEQICQSCWLQNNHLLVAKR